MCPNPARLAHPLVRRLALVRFQNLPSCKPNRPTASVSADSAYTRPVSGQVLAVWSGDELVYNETLGDWRTHNGTDYACKEGEDVLSPCERHGGKPGR